MWKEGISILLSYCLACSTYPLKINVEGGDSYHPQLSVLHVPRPYRSVEAISFLFITER